MLTYTNAKVTSLFAARISQKLVFFTGRTSWNELSFFVTYLTYSSNKSTKRAFPYLMLKANQMARQSVIKFHKRVAPSSNQRTNVCTSLARQVCRAANRKKRENSEKWFRVVDNRFGTILKIHLLRLVSKLRKHSLFWWMTLTFFLNFS